jgi:hypothetical protein
MIYPLEMTNALGTGKSPFLRDKSSISTGHARHPASSSYAWARHSRVTIFDLTRAMNQFQVGPSSKSSSHLRGGS